MAPGWSSPSRRKYHIFSLVIEQIEARNSTSFHPELLEKERAKSAGAAASEGEGEVVFQVEAHSFVIGGGHLQLVFDRIHVFLRNLTKF